MVGLGYALLDLLGSSTQVAGLACNPTAPPSLGVLVSPGRIYSLQNVDNTAYGSLAADTADQILKQGILSGSSLLSCPAPATSGFSINYLIEAIYQDSDTGATVLQYYDAANPSQAFSGPNNTGASQATVRQGLCIVQAKAGVPAITGTQTTPAPDAGYVGLWVVTVANGQATITASNITQYTPSTFLAPAFYNAVTLLDQARSNSTVLANDNYLSVTLTQPGWYELELGLAFLGTTTGTQGIQFGVSGTASYAAMEGVTNGYVNGGGLTFASFLANGGAGIGFATITVGTPDSITFRTTLHVTAPGTLALQWAQNTSSANNTTLKSGSRMVLQKIG